MSPEGSVSRWLELLQTGDSAAVPPLWERYFRRLVGLARQKLRDAPRRAADEEDVALSAFDSFCRQAEQGQFPNLLDRDSLWRLLALMTARKAAHLVRDASRQKRGGGVVVRGEDDADRTELPHLEQVLSREPTPEMAAQVAEEFQRLFQALGDPDLEQVAQLRLEGHSVEEIADQLGYAPRSIKRKLHLIRQIWEREIDS